MPLLTRHTLLFCTFAFVFPMVLALSESRAFLAYRFNLLEHTEASIWIFATGLLLILGGSYVGTLFWARTQPCLDTSRSELGRRDRTAVRLVWSAAFVSALIVLGPSPGEIISSIASLQTKSNDALEGQSVLFLCSTALITTAFIAAFITFHKIGKISSIDWVLLFTTAMLCFAIGSRYRGIAALAMPVYLLFIHGRIKFRWLLAAALASMAAVNFLLVLRTSAQGSAGSLTNFSFVEQFLSQWSIFDGLPISIALSYSFPLDPFQGLSNAILWAMPSSVVGEKTLAANMTARLILFRDMEAGITLGLFGEAYYYLGGLISAVFFFCLGFVLTKMDRVMRGTELAAAGALVFSCMFLLGSIRNGVFNDILSYFTISATLVTCWLAIRLFRTFPS